MKIGFLWLVLVVGMALHASYALSAIRFGADVTIEDATGAVPWSNAWLKTIFYVLPMLMGVGSVLWKHRGWRVFNFVGAVAFLLSNLSHVGTQGFRSGEPLEVAQTILLTAIALISVPLATQSFRHMRASSNATA